MNLQSRISLICLAISIVATITSCKKCVETVPASAPKCYEKFLGNYHVTDLQNGEEYDMSITHMQGIDDFGDRIDSLLMSNFANKFDVRFRFNCGIPPEYISWGHHFGIADFQGNHWALFSNNAGFVSVPSKNSIFNKDSIYFDFKLSNIAFYLSESVPYYNCESCVHLAVK